MIPQTTPGERYTSMVPSVTPPALLRRVRAANVALPKRLRAFNQLLSTLDRSFVTQDDSLLSLLLGCVPAADAVSHVAGKALPAIDAPTQAMSAQLPLSCAGISQLLTELGELLQRQLLPRLARYGLYLGSVNELTEPQLTWLGHYFRRWLYPMLTPLAVDPGHPFPRLLPNTSYLLVTLSRMETPSAPTPQLGDVLAQPAARLQAFRDFQGSRSDLSTAGTHPVFAPRGERELYGLIKVAAPHACLVPVPVCMAPDRASSSSSSEIVSHGAAQSEWVSQHLSDSARSTDGVTLLWRAEIVKHFIATFFPGMCISGVYQFRVLYTAEEAAISVPAAQPMLHATTGQTAESSRASYNVHSPVERVGIRYLNVEQAMPSHLIQWLVSHLHTSHEYVFQSPSLLYMMNCEELATRCED